MSKLLTEEVALSYGYSLEDWLSFSKTKRWRIRNPELQKQAMLSWKSKQSPESLRLRGRKTQLKLLYGLTVEDYNKMLAKQGHCCAICGTGKPTGKWKVFAVDHCHKTGKIRGLLCNECNRGMGLLKDSSDLLRKAADYLDISTNEERKQAKELKNAKQSI